MTVTPTFNSDVEAELLARANARGMAVQDYLQAIVEQDAISSSGKMSDRESTLRQDAIRRMIEFGEKLHASGSMKAIAISGTICPRRFRRDFPVL